MNKIHKSLLSIILICTVIIGCTYLGNKPPSSEPKWHAKLERLVKMYLVEAGIEPQRVDVLLGGTIRLHLENSEIRDLSSLEYMPICELTLSSTSISNVSSLGTLGMLKKLNIAKTSVSDLSPLGYLANLNELNISSTQVTDLSPLAKLPLETLYVYNTKVTNLEIIATMTNLHYLGITPKMIPEDVAKILRSKNLCINTFSYPADFWKEYDAEVLKEKHNAPQL